MGRVDGKVALISGGARGMGASHARVLAREGARVVIADLLDDEGLALAAELGEQGAFVHLDVTSPDDWQAAVDLAVARFGGLDILVNNAGISIIADIEQITLDQWKAIIAVNLTGVFLGMKTAVAALKNSRGPSIVNISSTAGLQGYLNVPGYNASKFGVRGLTKSAALDLGKYGIRVNSIHPGVIQTEMARGTNPVRDHVALHRVGEPMEVSNMVLFLASDESSFSTGAEFVADGGELAGRAQ
ncbi:SDR family oxidoreductase [soil metagenome]